MQPTLSSLCRAAATELVVSPIIQANLLKLGWKPKTSDNAIRSLVKIPGPV